MRSSARRAFNLDEESAHLRDRYGRNLFGQGCLLARRLIERGVPFVEVSLAGDNGNGWDTHAQNFDAVKRLSGVLDPAWSALMDDLRPDFTFLVAGGAPAQRSVGHGDRGQR